MKQPRLQELNHEWIKSYTTSIKRCRLCGLESTASSLEDFLDDICTESPGYKEVKVEEVEKALLDEE